jgi:cleavage and polyadenylation specificity factor subunit 2
MARIATTEDVEGIRDEEDPGDDGTTRLDADGSVEVERPGAQTSSGKYIATTQEVHDAFDSVNTLRYSQPTHLQGIESPGSSQAATKS